MSQKEQHRPDASWTDNVIWGQKAQDLSEAQLRKAAQAAGVDDQGGKKELVERLRDTEQPDGWKWEG